MSRCGELRFCKKSARGEMKGEEVGKSSRKERQIWELFGLSGKGTNRWSGLDRDKVGRKWQTSTGCAHFLST